MGILLDRDTFREAVLKRDKYKCVVCNKGDNLAVHHIMERKLFDNGGYFIDNGVSLCEEHHLEAEMTTLSCEELRSRAGIENIVLPEHLTVDSVYDKWANIVLENKTRLKGEMFFDEPVQKMLERGNFLSSFVDWVKFGKTFHVPWSPGLQSDDKMIKDCSFFIGKQVVVSVKKDGESASFYTDYYHARSVEKKNHKSRDYIKAMHAKFKSDIPKGWRVCGENLYAQHTIAYDNLRSYLEVISVWNEKNICISWAETKVWAELLGLVTVEVIYEGIWDEKLIRSLHRPKREGNDCEGYVIRLSDSFSYRDFKRATAKFVRAGHVQTDEHWMDKEVIPNKIKNKS